MVIVVPLAAGRLGRGKSRVDRYFFGSCALVTFCSSASFREGPPSALAAVATFAFSGLVALVYLHFPHSPARTLGLLVLLGSSTSRARGRPLQWRRGLAYFPFSLLTLA